MPAGFDNYIEDNLSEPIETSENEKRFRDYLESLKGLDGKPAFTKEYIDAACRNYKNGK